MSKKFKKNVENFACERCGFEVIGTGFTNHCSDCLWSKHVDKNPGDREAFCGGLMKPCGVEGTQAKYILIFKCEKCGLENRNKVFPEDNFAEVLKIARAKKPS